MIDKKLKNRKERIICEGEFIEADNPNIQYYGRIDFSDPKNPKFDWPGIYIVSIFEGSSLTIYMRDGGNDYNIFVNGKYFAKLVTEPEIELYPVVKNLKPGKHSIQITKRTEASYGIAIFKGLILDKGRKILSPPERPKAKIEFIGDSITCGYGNEGECHDCFSLRKYENNYMAFAPNAARALKAEYMITAISGSGIVHNCEDKNKISSDPLPFYYERTLKNKSSLKWDFKKWVPDIVVITLGGNDLSTPPYPAPSVFKSEYKKFLNFIRSKYSNAHIFCVCNKPHKDVLVSWLQKIVQDINKKGDRKVYYTELPSVRPDELGCDNHPNTAAHKRFADVLVPILKKKIPFSNT